MRKDDAPLFVSLQNAWVSAINVLGLERLVRVSNMLWGRQDLVNTLQLLYTRMLIFLRKVLFFAVLLLHFRAVSQIDALLGISNFRHQKLSYQTPKHFCPAFAHVLFLHIIKIIFYFQIDVG